jgi:hypothetical protein
MMRRPKTGFLATLAPANTRVAIHPAKLYIVPSSRMTPSAEALFVHRNMTALAWL